MKNSENPWQGMKPLERRRVDTLERKFECYWVTDKTGKYGYLLESTDFFDAPTVQLKLKGIIVFAQNSDKGSSLILVLDEKENWQIFLALCNDLSKASKNQENAKSFISAVQARLTRWQKLLQRTKNKSMSREMQMGLFTELTCLKEILEPKIGIKQSLNAWVGPEFDKQDFLLDGFILEIKSYRTSKTPVASISSSGQLFSEKEPIYLISYALTTSDNGSSIDDLIDEIEEIIGESENRELTEAFNLKLDSYGYIPDISNETPLLKFLVDNFNIYHVNDDFPKLITPSIPLQINHLQYGIDLSRCSEFLVDIEDIF
jgi:hypothetical protein